MTLDDPTSNELQNRRRTETCVVGSIPSPPLAAETLDLGMRTSRPVGSTGAEMEPKLRMHTSRSVESYASPRRVRDWATPVSVGLQELNEAAAEDLASKLGLDAGRHAAGGRTR